MSPKSFFKYIDEALKHGCELLGVNTDSILIGDAPPKTGIYGREIWFDGKAYWIELDKNVKPSTLLCAYVDFTAHRIRIIENYLKKPYGHPFLERTGSFCAPEEWAEDIYLDLQNQLFQTYESGLGLRLGLVDELSSMPYEGDQCSGGLVFVEDTHADLDPVLPVRIQTEGGVYFEWRMRKHIRKLLAGAGEHFLAFQREIDDHYTDEDDLYVGSRYTCKGYCTRDQAHQMGWTVLFRGTLEWEFSYKKYPLFRMSHYSPKVIQDPIEVVLKELKAEFAGLPLHKARPLLKSAQGQRHGTALIFGDFMDPVIDERVQRLYASKRAVQVELPGTGDAVKAAKEAIKNLSRMDGAIFVDVNSMTLKYVAAIVDGRVQAQVPGRLDRGARHNSIQTFLADLDPGCGKGAPRIAAVIFSEDGGALTICGQDVLSEKE